MSNASKIERLAPEDARDGVPSAALARELKAVGARCFVRSVRHTSNIVTRVYNVYLKAAGVEVTQFWILCAIAAGQAGSSTELADMLGVEKSTLKRALDRMGASGLIARQPGEGRRVLHVLTDRGRAKLTAAMPYWRKAQADMELDLSPSQVEQILGGLKALRARARGLLKHNR